MKTTGNKKKGFSIKELGELQELGKLKELVDGLLDGDKNPQGINKFLDKTKIEILSNNLEYKELKEALEINEGLPKMIIENQYTTHKEKLKKAKIKKEKISDEFLIQYWYMLQLKKLKSHIMNIEALSKNLEEQQNTQTQNKFNLKDYTSYYNTRIRALEDGKKGLQNCLKNIRMQTDKETGGKGLVSGVKKAFNVKNSYKNFVNYLKKEISPFPIEKLEKELNNRINDIRLEEKEQLVVRNEKSLSEYNKQLLAQQRKLQDKKEKINVLLEEEIKKKKIEKKSIETAIRTITDTKEERRSQEKKIKTLLKELSKKPPTLEEIEEEPKRKESPDKVLHNNEIDPQQGQSKILNAPFKEAETIAEKFESHIKYLEHKLTEELKDFVTNEPELVKSINENLIEENPVSCVSQINQHYSSLVSKYNRPFSAVENFQEKSQLLQNIASIQKKQDMLSNKAAQLLVEIDKYKKNLNSVKALIDRVQLQQVSKQQDNISNTQNKDSDKALTDRVQLQQVSKQQDYSKGTQNKNSSGIKKFISQKGSAILGSAALTSLVGVIAVYFFAAALPSVLLLSAVVGSVLLTASLTSKSENYKEKFTSAEYQNTSTVLSQKTIEEYRSNRTDKQQHISTCEAYLENEAKVESVIKQYIDVLNADKTIVEKKVRSLKAEKTRLEADIESLEQDISYIERENREIEDIQNKTKESKSNREYSTPTEIVSDTESTKTQSTEATESDSDIQSDNDKEPDRDSNRLNNSFDSDNTTKQDYNSEQVSANTVFQRNKNLGLNR